MRSLNTLMFLAIPLVVLSIVLILRVGFGRSRRALVRERAGSTEDGFVEQLSTIGFDPRISRTTYRFLQEEKKARYPLLLDDTLDGDLGMNREDVEETVVALLRANRRTLAPARQGPILTVEDLIRFIQASPPTDQRAA